MICSLTGPGDTIAGAFFITKLASLVHTELVTSVTARLGPIQFA